ncbi:TetR/AcrR family transcriptional regulator [Gordonia sihwensis]|uniref:TetR/AcrR family transcriptional regulator n=1 Tax=Gordonia sihwensis TaxID=173559 RepID=UPI00061EF4B0|nr:TetR/AcrR family transcriptional regulator [Gordonia sihwensis]KJR07886.1 TetR family transcriptional regulator [Gordonia sihwensis]
MTHTRGKPEPTRWGDREQRRIDILRSGEALLMSGGYDALRMRDVAAGADISLGTVYTYYPNKESLFIAIFAHRLDAMMARLAPAIASARDAVEAFTVTVNMYREDYQIFGRQFDALSLGTLENEVQAEAADLLRQSTERMVAALSSVLLRFGYEGDPAPAMTLLWATMRGLANHYASLRQQFLVVPWDDAVRFAAESLTRSFGLGMSPGSD